MYRTELEEVEGFHEFEDFCETFHLARGKKKDVSSSESVGEFKVRAWVAMKTFT